VRAEFPVRASFRAVHIEIINTGSEVMLGLVLNTHHQWLARQLADRGYRVARQTAVADHGPTIQAAVRESLGRADVVIVTGGLGPTSDDITRTLIAQLLERPLRTDAAVLKHVEDFFALRKRVMPASCAVQAQVLEGATVLMNQHGTAPGLAMEVPSGKFRDHPRASLLIMLPGPPRELHPMFRDQALALIQKHIPLEGEFVCRTLRTCGIGESFLEEKVGHLLQPLVDAGLELGYCARSGEVDVRLIARSPVHHHDAAKLVAEAEAIVRQHVGEYIFGTNEEQLHEVIVRLLTERKQTLALAESCTGGFVANRITNVSGASAVFLAGLVTYSNEAKMRFLGVSAETLAAHGAVSRETAIEMAEGARKVTGADFAIGITGIAGPTGGTPTKPVGTVFIALAGGGGTRVINPTNRYERETFKYLTSQQALELLRRRLLHAEG
jgi:nicotinamide-nucleotide amidase